LHRWSQAKIAPWFGLAPVLGFLLAPFLVFQPMRVRTLAFVRAAAPVVGWIALGAVALGLMALAVWLLILAAVWLFHHIPIFLIPFLAAPVVLFPLLAPSPSETVRMRNPTMRL